MAVKGGEATKSHQKLPNVLHLLSRQITEDAAAAAAAGAGAGCCCCGLLVLVLVLAAAGCCGLLLLPLLLLPLLLLLLLLSARYRNWSWTLLFPGAPLLLSAGVGGFRGMNIQKIPEAVILRCERWPQGHDSCLGGPIWRPGTRCLLCPSATAACLIFRRFPALLRADENHGRGAPMATSI